MNRRDFLKRATRTAFGAGLLARFGLDDETLVAEAKAKYTLALDANIDERYWEQYPTVVMIPAGGKSNGS